LPGDKYAAINNLRGINVCKYVITADPFGDDNKKSNSSSSSSGNGNSNSNSNSNPAMVRALGFIGW
jgi:hypothetical protein